MANDVLDGELRHNGSVNDEQEARNKGARVKNMGEIVESALSEFVSGIPTRLQCRRKPDLVAMNMTRGAERGTHQVNL